MRTEAHRRADAKYRAEKVHRVPLDLKKRDFAALSAVAQSAAEGNVNSFIRAAIEEKIDRDGLRNIAESARSEYDKTAKAVV